MALLEVEVTVSMYNVLYVDTTVVAGCSICCSPNITMNVYPQKTDTEQYSVIYVCLYIFWYKEAVQSKVR